MSTLTPATTLLLIHVVGRLQTISTPNYRTDIGASVSTERGQTDDDAGPQVCVRITGWTRGDEGVVIERNCALSIEVQVDATVANAEAQAELAIEDVWELFRMPAGEVVLRPDPYTAAMIGVVESAVVERPNGARGVVAALTLSAVLREVVPLPVPEEV